MNSTEKTCPNVNLSCSNHTGKEWVRNRDCFMKLDSIMPKTQLYKMQLGELAFRKFPATKRTVTKNYRYEVNGTNTTRSHHGPPAQSVMCVSVLSITLCHENFFGRRNMQGNVVGNKCFNNFGTEFRNTSAV
jgi:hypothetical protein